MIGKTSAFTRILMAFGSDKSGGVKKEIYGIPGASWTSNTWNWGFANGTGHDAAMICRNKYSSKMERTNLIDSLLNPSLSSSDEETTLSPMGTIVMGDDRDPPFEEVKLILGLTWQNGRWDGSDGGIGGYSDILREMANAQRYEGGDDVDLCMECNRNFIQDMQKRYNLISSEEGDIKKMSSLLDDISNEDTSDMDAARRICSGLVLKSMGFIEKGL